MERPRALRTTKEIPLGFWFQGDVSSQSGIRANSYTGCMTLKEQGVLATLLTHQEVLALQQTYATLERCCEATGYDLMSLRQRSIRLNVRWKQDRTRPAR